MYYDRRLKKNDRDLHLFFLNSYQGVCSKSVSLSAKLGDNILRIGKRSSCNFFRVYLRPNGKDLRFEIELKKTFYVTLVGVPYLASILIEEYAFVFLDSITFQRKKK